MTDDIRIKERQHLVDNLHDAVVQCLNEFGDKETLVRENDNGVEYLLWLLENVFLHGFKRINRFNSGKQLPEKGFHPENQQQLDFWDCIKHPIKGEHYGKLREIHSNLGRSRAWLRISLNENSLQNYVNELLEPPEFIKNYYDPWAFLRDQEKVERLKNMAYKLESINFVMNIDNADLDLSINPALIPLYLISGPGKKKEPSSKITVFDENEKRQIPGPIPVSYHQFPKCLRNQLYSEDSDSFFSVHSTHCQADNSAISEDFISIHSFGEDTENFATTFARIVKNVTPDELRKAFLEILHTKEVSEEEINRDLFNILNQEMESDSDPEAQMEDQIKYSSGKMDKLGHDFSGFIEESSQLKNRLEKYISESQAPKQSSIHSYEVLSEIEPATPESIGHQSKAFQYEQNQAQLAENPGEIIKISDELHQLLLETETTIVCLRDELVKWRDLIQISDYDQTSQTLINCWVPEAFPAVKFLGEYHVYKICIQIRNTAWVICRRYSQFHSFHKELKKKDSIVNTFYFPPKKFVGNKEPEFVEDRRLRLQKYLRSVIKWLLKTNPEFASDPDKESFIYLVPFFAEDETLPIRVSS